MSESKLIARAVDLAELAVEHGNHPFGALLADSDGKIVLEAENTVDTDKDVTAHAETNLVRLASRKLTATQRSELTLYTSTEPCTMCCGAIYWARITKVVYSCPSRVLEEIVQGEYEIPSAELFARMKNPSITSTGPVDPERAIGMHKSFWPKKLGLLSESS